MDGLYGLLPERVRLGAAALSVLAMLLGACGGGGSDSGGTSPPPPPPPPPPPSGSVTVSGTAAYEFVPPNPVCQGLNFNAIEIRPIRGATVQLLDSSGVQLASTTTDAAGGYAFANVAPNTNLRLRVRAEARRAGAPGWDIEVRDNVVAANDPNPPALANRPLYAIVSDFNSGSAATLTRNVTARTGWDGSAYTGTRAAAPFAILDAIYTAVQFVVAVDPGVTLAPLDAFWSVNNIKTTATDIDAGELVSQFYDPNLDSLFLTGDAGTDTTEFDDHVIVHEWGHFFEDTLSRSDSIGGPHGIGDRLDARLAFGEGWATALSGMALNNPLYCDTGPAGASFGLLALGTEEGAYDPSGWYDEISVLRFIYDLWDTTNFADGTEPDNGSIGFAPIYQAMVGPQAFTDSFTTIFSFAAELRTLLPQQADRDFLDAQLVREDMTPGFDKWGAGELNDASPALGQSRDVLPLYTDLTADGSVVNICSNDDYDGAGDGNKLATYRYLRIAVPATAQYDVSVVTTTTAALPPDDPADPRDQSDPDIALFRDGLVADFGLSGDANQEIFTTTTLSGPDIYVADLREFRYADPNSPFDFPTQMCFDVSMTPVP